MARQSGIFKVEGTLDEVNFFKTASGYKLRRKGGVSRDRIATDPAFVRTRENCAEFGRAGKAGKIMRTAFMGLLKEASDPRITSRLTTQMLKVIKTDTLNARGLRTVVDGELELINGFEFNIQGKLSTTLYAPYSLNLDRAAGKGSITLLPFIPANMIAAPAGATHFVIVSGTAELDFESGAYVVDTKQTAQLPIDNIDTAAINLENTVPVASTMPLIMVLGVAFYQEVNNVKYPLKNGAFNALAVVRVDVE